MISNKRYQIILADPPWKYQDVGCRGAAEQYYPTMSKEDIADLPINDIADSDCVLFLWSTFPMLPEALHIIKAWGFTYKSIAFLWLKLNRSGVGYFYGVGRWTRGNSEPCLLAMKGKPQRQDKSIFQLIRSRVREHSRKPDEQYRLIETLMGKLPRIELFARQRWDGWDAWGNETPLSIQKILTS